MKKVFVLISISFSIFSFAQHSEIFKLKKFRVTVLNDSIQETSGLNLFNEKLFTFNDSGNSPELFQIDQSTGKIFQKFKITAENKDWEALTNDGENFYIGDFGNNSGTRQDLKILKIPFKNNQLLNDSLKTISFFFPEQKDFSSKNLSTDFDLEALIYLDGKLHLFTKEWISKSTTHYMVDPEIYQIQPAQKIESYKTNFVVTDATYFEKKLFVVGYTKKTEVFLMIFNESEPGVFFKSQAKKYYLGSAINIGQIEGIAVNKTGIFISGEKLFTPVKKTKSFFYFIPIEKLRF